VEIDIPKPGIAVRIEIPREFLEPGGVPIPENDTSFVTSNIRNDYYYYNLVDESRHWTYDWHDNASDGPCFKPNFSYYDPNAPYCLEIWNYLSSPLDYSTSPPSPLLMQPDYTIYCYVPGPESYYDSASPCPSNYFTNHIFDYTYLVGVDYCQPPNLDKFVYQCFSASPTAPKFVLLHGLSSPGLAGVYNFTLSVANRTNILGYPDFVHAWTTTLQVPVSMAYNAGFIAGNVCDAGSVPLGESCNSVAGPIRGKGVVYAVSEATGGIVARAYLNQSLCEASVANCGLFNLTGLAPGDYEIEGSAGVDDGFAYSLTFCCSGGPTTPANPPATINVPPNSQPGFTTLPLRRAPTVCGTITYENSTGPINSLSGNLYLIAAGFGIPNFNLNVTVEGTDPSGDVFRFQGVSSGTKSDDFTVMTGVGLKYVGTDPYGTEFAGLPAPEDFGPSGYTITLNVWVSGYIQDTSSGFPTVQILPWSGNTPPACSPASIILLSGGILRGNLTFESSPGNPESPREAASQVIPTTTGQALFGGNVVIEAYDQTGILRGVTVINGTLPDGATGYASADYTDNAAFIPFFVVGFTEYYDHSLSGGWDEHDYGLPSGTYSLSVYVRGYEQNSSCSVSITMGGSGPVLCYMLQGGAFEVTVASFDNRLGTTAPQACLPWRFVDSTIPVRARVYFFGPGGPVGYVEVLMADVNTILSGVVSFVKGPCGTFQVVFAGQNWSLRDIWFYGESPTYVTDAAYMIDTYTLGYVPQFVGGVSVQNYLANLSPAYETLFYGNEIDETVPIFSTPLTESTTPENDQAIGQAVSGSLLGAEMANLIAGTSNLGFNIYGFGGMQLPATPAICETDVYLRGLEDICGQGHFFYVAPDGSRDLDYGLDVGNYTAQVPEFGFTAHFLQVSSPPTVSFPDLFLQEGVVFPMIQMALITQGPNSAVQGWTFGVPTQVAPLSWAEVQASNSTYSQIVSTADGTYDGVGALFLPGGTYNVTFSDIQYQSQTVYNFQVGWGSSYSLTPTYLCPIGSTC
jgi:hypothetical protein